MGKLVNIENNFLIATASYSENPELTFGIYFEKKDRGKILLFPMDQITTTGFISLCDYEKKPFEREFKINTLYRHYKNKDYFALYPAIHPVEKQEYAIYMSLYAPYKLWARPMSMFLDFMPEKNENRFTEIA